ncbi:hypothetical protein D4N07_11190 [Enterobacter hormaechei]|uniref:type VI secretion system protein n=1 Tax=Enterobacter hormaechei TaxID=158836 RepID=UPI0011DCAC53|nr:type VI secretion system protein [Enterobacter hormaechei]TXU04847.1 hypothetical protein D4N07_11190 [Enterobacter hormaechei]
MHTREKLLTATTKDIRAATYYAWARLRQLPPLLVDGKTRIEPPNRTSAHGLNGSACNRAGDAPAGGADCN